MYHVLIKIAFLIGWWVPAWWGVCLRDDDGALVPSDRDFDGR
jgi:hypothetical protein